MDSSANVSKDEDPQLHSSLHAEIHPRHVFLFLCLKHMSVEKNTPPYAELVTGRFDFDDGYTGVCFWRRQGGINVFPFAKWICIAYGGSIV